MLWKAGYGHCRSRWHCGSWVIISPGAGGGINQMQVCDGLVPAQSCIPLSIWTLASTLPLELGTIGPYRPESIGLHLYDKMARR